MGVAKVQILTTPDCAGCAVVERMLDRNGIKYQVIDVARNPGVLKKYPIMSAPGIVINGKLEFMGVPDEKELLERLKPAGPA